MIAARCISAGCHALITPERLIETHVPGGYSPPGITARAIRGHELGLKLSAPERAQRIALLRSL